ncbi:MAG: thioredoxin peroxidase [Proteobacteria bacterium SG_bin7]|nr:MAG: thioredoxin peroxidase [Proteobacteria bacterium SG_bin7]
MGVLVGKKAPNFKATAVFGSDFKDIELSQYEGKYVVLFFYPLDFTFVCPTELHAFQEKLSAFKERNVEVLACSVDSKFSHHAWLNTPKNKGGIEGVKYGLVADLGGKIATQYDVLSSGGIAYRGLFLIDKEGVVRHQVINDLPLGRNVDEAIRMVDALQHNEKHGEVCPANWTKGGEAMKATHEGVSKYLSKK